MPEHSFSGSKSLKWKWLRVLDRDSKMAFNLQYGKVYFNWILQMFWFLMTFSQEIEKHQLIPFLAQNKLASG